MTSRYNHKIAEQKWQKTWAENKTFSSGKDLTKNKYSLSKVSVSRSINQKGKDDSESGIKELLITNFKFQVPTQMKLGI